MATATIGATRSTSARRKALRACAEALRVAVNYRLPSPLQRKLRKALDEKERPFVRRLQTAVFAVSDGGELAR